jgi:hypothetical protein
MQSLDAVHDTVTVRVPQARRSYDTRFTSQQRRVVHTCRYAIRVERARRQASFSTYATATLPVVRTVAPENSSLFAHTAVQAAS